VELSRRIGDAVALASTNGKVLTADERSAYVNKSLQELFRMYWDKTNGDKELFARIFPELLVMKSILIDVNGKYAVDVLPTANYFRLIDGVRNSDSQYVKSLPDTFYNIVSTGINDLYTASAKNLIAIEYGRTLYFFPVLEFATKTVTINYLTSPLKEDGTLITQGGNEDSPFNYHWNSEIAAIAEKLVRTDRQYAT